jgi:RNA polymerase-binding transcription factor DksA
MSTVPPSDAEILRAAIVQAQAATAARAAALQREFDEIVESGSLTNTDDEHDPDGATIAYERARTSALLAAAREDLDYLRTSEDRLDAGTFGLCRTCGAYIGVERLLARPTVRDCITCAR